MDRKSDTPRVVLLCASHVADDFRAERLLELVDSWCIQTLPCDMYLSLSTNLTEHQVSVLREKLQRLSVGAQRSLEIRLRPHQLSQFKHYELLAKELLELDPRVWLLFCDDDDLMDRHRVEFHCSAIRQALTEKDANKQPWMFVAWPHGVAFGPGTHLKLTAGVIPGGKTASLRQKEIDDFKHKQYRQYAKGAHTDEYHQYAVPLWVLCSFTKLAGSYLLEHRFADLFFVRYLHSAIDDEKFLSHFHNPNDAEEKNWYYIHLGGASDSASHSVGRELPLDIQSLESVKKFMKVPGCDEQFALDTIQTVVTDLEIFCSIFRGDKKDACSAFYEQWLTIYKDRKKFDSVTILPGNAESWYHYHVPGMRGVVLESWKTNHFQTLLSAPLLTSCNNPICNKKGTKICTRCRKSRYCCQPCQSEDWEAHKELCKQMSL